MTNPIRPRSTAPRNFEPKRALKLGFTTAEKTFDDIIRIHIEDELGGKFVA